MSIDWTGIVDRIIEGMPGAADDTTTLVDGALHHQQGHPLLVLVHPDVVSRIDMDMRDPEQAAACAERFADVLESWHGDVVIMLSDNIDGIADMKHYSRLKTAIDRAADGGAHVWLTPETQAGLKYAGIDLVEKLGAESRPDVCFAGGFADSRDGSPCGCLAHVVHAYEAIGGQNASVSDAVACAHGEPYEPSRNPAGP